MEDKDLLNGAADSLEGIRSDLLEAITSMWGDYSKRDAYYTLYTIRSRMGRVISTLGAGKPKIPLKMQETRGRKRDPEVSRSLRAVSRETDLIGTDAVLPTEPNWESWDV